MAGIAFLALPGAFGVRRGRGNRVGIPRGDVVCGLDRGLVVPPGIRDAIEDVFKLGSEKDRRKRQRSRERQRQRSSSQRAKKRKQSSKGRVARVVDPVRQTTHDFADWSSTSQGRSILSIMVATVGLLALLSQARTRRKTRIYRNRLNVRIQNPRPSVDAETVSSTDVSSRASSQSKWSISRMPVLASNVSSDGAVAQNSAQFQSSVLHLVKNSASGLQLPSVNELIAVAIASEMPPSLIVERFVKAARLVVEELFPERQKLAGKMLVLLTALLGAQHALPVEIQAARNRICKIFGLSDADGSSNAVAEAKLAFRPAIKSWLSGANPVVEECPPVHIPGLLGLSPSDTGKILSDELRVLMKTTILRCLRTGDYPSISVAIRFLRKTLEFFPGHEQEYFERFLKGSVRDVGMEGRAVFAGFAKLQTADVIMATLSSQHQQPTLLHSNVGILAQIISIPRITLDTLKADAFQAVISESIDAGLHLRRTSFEKNPGVRAQAELELSQQLAMERSQIVVEEKMRSWSTEKSQNELMAVQSFLGDSISNPLTMSATLRKIGQSRLKENVSKYLSTKKVGLTNEDIDELRQLANNEGLSEEAVLEEVISLCRGAIQSAIASAISASSRGDLNMLVSQLDSVVRTIDGIIDPVVDRMVASGAYPNAPMMRDEKLVLSSKFSQLELLRVLRNYFELVRGSQKSRRDLVRLFQLQGVADI